jgi:outer membrane autotransporter protein
MLRPKSVVSQRRVAAIVAPLALVLSMSISHQAVAQTVNCSAGDQVADGDTFCVDDSSNSGAIGNTGQHTGSGAANSAVRLDADGASFTNAAAGEIKAEINSATSNNYRSDLFGINADGDEDTSFSVVNDGKIVVEHAGIGRAWGISEGGDTGEMTIVNTGTIVVERGPIDISTFTSSSVTATPTSSGLSANTLREAAGIYAEEEAELLEVFNSGSITATGTFSAAIYGRAVLTSITNEGGGKITNVGGVAIGAVSDSNETRALELKNDDGATISGDILAVNGHALRWWGLTNGLGTSGQNLDDRLNITSNTGILDSEIENEGLIKGNVYYSNGEHVLINSGEIQGDIDVDQRDTVNGAVTNAGARSFTFENAGELEGDLTVRTVAGSGIVFAPHIFGGAMVSSEAAPSEESAFIEGTLKVGEGLNADGTGGTGTMAATFSIAPVIDSLVKTGEWYLVAEKLDAINIGELPSIDNSVLVSWSASSTAGSGGDALAIGATVADASIVSGLSNPGIATLNALMQGGDDATNALGGAVQNLGDEDDVRKAGEQLKPETNFATQQAAFTLNMLTGNYIDNRLNGVGATAPTTTSYAAPSGLGMSQTASATPAGRMSLGLGTDDGRMSIGANDGRMDAGIYDDNTDLRQRGYSSAVWGQAFGAGLDQGERSNVDGYQSHIYGALAGADNWISSNTRLGFAAGYGNTSIDGSGDTLQNETDIDSYLGVIYGAYKGDGWYLSTRAGYAWHDYSTTRVVTVPVSDTATGSHSGNQYSAAAEIGAPLHYMGGTLTPVASVTWSQLDQDGYTEASGNGAGLTIASQENTSLASGLGAKALVPIDRGTLLEGRAIWYHEFEDTNQQVTAAFAGGSSFLASGPSVGRDTAAVGVGLFAYAQTGVSFQLNYDALLRQDFIGHTGSGRVKVEF